jgi:hypothetical protein
MKRKAERVTVRKKEYTECLEGTQKARRNNEWKKLDGRLDGKESDGKREKCGRKDDKTEVE